MTDPIHDPQRLIESDLDAGLRHDLELARTTRVGYGVEAGLSRFEATLAGASTLPSGGTLAGFGVLRWFLAGGGLIVLGVVAWLSASSPDEPAVAEQARAPTTVERGDRHADEVRSEDEVAELAANPRGSGSTSSVVGDVSQPDTLAGESAAGAQPGLGRGTIGDSSDGGTSESEPAALPRPASKSSPRERPDPQLAALDEAKLIDAARKALVDDPARTLELTKEASERFPSGAMVQERRGYAILALVALDRRDEADAMASEYLERWPKGPLSRRVREALGLLP